MAARRVSRALPTPDPASQLVHVRLEAGDLPAGEAVATPDARLDPRLQWLVRLCRQCSGLGNSHGEPWTVRSPYRSPSGSSSARAIRRLKIMAI